ETGYFYLLGLITWVVATLVWMQQPDNRAARISYLMSIGFMNICSVDATFSIQNDTLSSRIVPLSQFFAAAILPCLFLHCFLIFPAEKKIAQRYGWLLKVLYLPGIVLCAAMSFFYLRGHDYAREFFLIQLPPLENITTGFLFAYSVAGQLLLLHTSFAAPSRSQLRQARWLLLGIATGTLPQAIFTTIPKVWDVSIPYVRFSAYTLCLIPICYVVAIIRHRLMNIELIINRSVVYTLVSGFALGIYLLSIQGLTMFFHTAARSRTVTAISVLIAAVLFAPAKTRIQNWIDRAFDREAYNYRQTLLALSQTLHSILDLEILVDTLLRQVTEAMHIGQGVVMYRVSGSQPQFVPEATVGIVSLPHGLQLTLSPSLLEQLQRAKKPLDFSDRPLDRNSIQFLEGSRHATIASPNSESVADFIALLRSAVWIPFVTRTKAQENLVGILVLGQKLSEEPYSQTDLALLGTLAHQGATAVENATLYAELSARTKAMEMARGQLMATYLDTYGGTMPEMDRRGTESGDLVSDFNNIAAALKASHDRLKQLDTLKSQFLDNVSHELRTPLTHIKGFVDNLLDGVGGKLSEKQAKYLLRVKDNCDRLIRLINDLLDLSQIESGKISLQLKPTRLYPILEATIAGIQPMADKKAIQIHPHCDPDAIVLIDADKMGQIMTNLLDNAVKYTGSGGHVGISVTRLSNRELQICVEDTGIGIAEAELDLIFDRFHRVAGSKNSGISGIGLGLPIVKNLVELHGGNVWVESRPGKGSRFYLTLKCERD
ncbi:MAG: ATP-binding protein, partial [Candidatus Poribacteria bacterium]|nr:ATP-binding protein [Candidatus Poribacteria bacterium]